MKIGLARGSSLAKIAQPLKTVNAKDGLSELAFFAQQTKAVGIAVGLPRSLNGVDTAQTKVVRDWAKTAKKQINLPFYWQDEALTSHQASMLKTKTDADEHSLAASILLQDFLDTPEEQRVRI